VVEENARIERYGHFSLWRTSKERRETRPVCSVALDDSIPDEHLLRLTDAYCPLKSLHPGQTPLRRTPCPEAAFERMEQRMQA
jgi:hypothetical protein